MEAKEICFKVLEKFNDKGLLKEYKASLNKGQGIEAEYLFHSIEKKLEDIACDELLKLL